MRKCYSRWAEIKAGCLLDEFIKGKKHLITTWTQGSFLNRYIGFQANWGGCIVFSDMVLCFHIYTYINIMSLILQLLILPVHVIHDRKYKWWLHKHGALFHPSQHTKLWHNCQLMENIYEIDFSLLILPIWMYVKLYWKEEASLWGKNTFAAALYCI